MVMGVCQSPKTILDPVCFFSAIRESMEINIPVSTLQPSMSQSISVNRTSILHRTSFWLKRIPWMWKMQLLMKQRHFTKVQNSSLQELEKWRDTTCIQSLSCWILLITHPWPNSWIKEKTAALCFLHIWVSLCRLMSECDKEPQHFKGPEELERTQWN